MSMVPTSSPTSTPSAGTPTPSTGTPTPTQTPSPSASPSHCTTACPTCTQAGQSSQCTSAPGHTGGHACPAGHLWSDDGQPIITTMYVDPQTGYTPPSQYQQSGTTTWEQIEYLLEEGTKEKIKDFGKEAAIEIYNTAVTGGLITGTEITAGGLSTAGTLAFIFIPALQGYTGECYSVCPECAADISQKRSWQAFPRYIACTIDASHVNDGSPHHCYHLHFWTGSPVGQADPETRKDQPPPSLPSSAP